ncbi:acyltransferase family protein [Paenibacillus sp. GP183]|uniref:acyltransferase family protein n=1 Tax=Paenibacillus sp. GP183 TaxID=1882751 RepID=UPI00344DBF5F
MKSTPFHFFWAGHETVILFFVLSGFVLSLPYHNNKAPTHKEYLIKRICRIYIPYIFSIIFSMVLMGLVSRMGIPDLSTWFNSIWVTPPLLQSIINHIVLLGQFEAISFNPVIWSMIHEMRISILFPFIMYFVIKNNWKKNLVMTLSIPILIFLT